ncbi:MAG TPA: hydrogen peroxide-inducible genes activator [Casimicrobium sp.]|jgi:LysR family hydrogen peroxide-inducible transcriptional activator|nr:hydrogen peroxide-inducible genes activator [Burkholderiales bacterium]HPG61855.1 hydrogen peroxide-inducible genes activator [Casimicrobium sp.]
MAALPSLQQLRYLIALDEERHFGRAADKSFITQSTLSASLRDLESTLDVTLVERDRRHVAFTAIGDAVVARARDLISQANDLTELCASSRNPLTGTFRLGVIPTIAPFALPTSLATIRTQFPKLKLFLREDLTAVCLERLLASALDAALIALPYDLPAGIETLPLFDDEFLFVTADAKLGSAQSPLPIEKIDSDQLLLLEDGHCLRDHAIAACSLQSLQTNRTLSATSLITLTHMVASGLGHTLLPELAIAGGVLSGSSLYARRFTPRGPSRTIALAFRKTSARRDEIAELGKIFAQSKGFTGTARAKTVRNARIAKRA